MAIPLLGLIPKILKTAASILGIDSVKDVVEAIESNKLTPEQRVALDVAAKQYQLDMRQLDLEEVKQAVNESVAMISSSDKYVSRARPTMLYAATFITVFLAGVMGVVLLKHITIEWGAVGAMSSLLGPLWGVAGYYTGKRTQEKLNGNGNGD